MICRLISGGTVLGSVPVRIARLSLPRHCFDAFWKALRACLGDVIFVRLSAATMHRLYRTVLTFAGLQIQILPARTETRLRPPFLLRAISVT
jgi:hypothetical protein